jgi:predicted dehydrogenase
VTASIGICSVAHPHANAYAEVLTDLDAVEFVGVVDDEAERGRQFADENDTWLRSRTDLLSRADGVIVCSANANRKPWIRTAAEAGVDILAEKPLGTSAKEARHLAGICSDADVALDVAMPLRHSVPARQARERLNVVGDLIALSGTNRGQFPGGWFADPDLSGGGAVMDHTVHIVDLVHWLTDTRVAEVYAETGTRFTDAAVEDVNVLSMELDDGTPFLLDGSWSKPDEWPSWGDATLEITGTECVLELDCFAQRFEVIRDEDPMGASSVFYGTDPNRVMLERFVETISGEPPAAPPADAADALAVVEAAYESIDRGEPVAVEY